MNEQKKIVPKLRFPEFQEAGGWSPKELGECLDYLQPTEYLVNSTAYSDSYKTPVVTAGKTFILGYTDETDGVFSQPLPTIIFDDFTTASQFVDFPFKAKSSAMKILLAKKNANIKFLYESMQQIDYEVGAHGRHWISAYSKIKVATPEPNEQQKIANCLSSLDELIAAQARKVEALKTHKKGLMQQLFPREGETQPRLRFPEFRDAGDWLTKPFAKMFSIGSGKDHQHLTPGDIPVYGSGGYMRSVGEYLYEGESVCIGRKGTINNPMLLRGKFWTVDTLFFTHTFIDCLPQFIFLIFQNINWLKHNEAGGVPSLSKLNIEKIEAAIPSILEQQRIADCLTVLDTLITAAIQELDSLKTHKKGLMQQLFPSAQEAQA